ncbi:hypothetical protein TrVE_jg7571 [Triparma verrucosa]|uniref:DUF2428 domain-containing protein n=1 Tax=Triparma verrucosa TaxID=1606542 RepID=A0A9W7BWD9_9STRA|nr:hypothetical protein TrVE_jg7571 [Triparma verrucosa]
MFEIQSLKSPEQLYSYLSLSTTSNSPEIARASLSRLHFLNHHATLPQIQTFLTRWESSEGWGRVLTDCLKKPKEENLYNDILKIISSSSIKIKLKTLTILSHYLSQDILVSTFKEYVSIFVDIVSGKSSDYSNAAGECATRLWRCIKAPTAELLQPIIKSLNTQPERQTIRVADYLLTPLIKSSGVEIKTTVLNQLTNLSTKLSVLISLHPKKGSLDVNVNNPTVVLGLNSNNINCVIKSLSLLPSSSFLLNFKKCLKTKSTSAPKELKDIVEKFKDKKVEDTVVEVICRFCLYPGACESKEFMALTFLNLLPPDDKFLPHVLGALDSLWDTSRGLAGRIINNIVLKSSVNVSSSLYEKGIKMASSPRTRESDSGARILGLLGEGIFVKLRDLTKERVEEMEMYLGGKKVPESSKEEKNLPLAHGLLKGLCGLVPKSPYDPVIFNVAQKAVNISLKIVSTSKDPLGDDLSPGYQDVDKGYCHADFESHSQHLESFRASVESLNVNSGCLGTNGIVGGLDSSDESEKINVQRIVVGTWLLAKEGCTLITQACLRSGRSEDFEEGGKTLIETITTLKHQGAASAAMTALQELCEGCYRDQKLRHLPSKWLDQLIEIISNPETGESTLRRSSGFGFGFLAILKAEASKNESALCERAMECLVRMCLPPASEIRMHESRLGMKFSPPISEGGPDSWKSRVHALNILRLLLLSTSLSHNLKPYYTLSLQISLIGFTSHSWAVSNSCTMVFSASMTRAVDSDKNTLSSLRLGSGENKAKGGHEVIHGEFETFLEKELKSPPIPSIDQNTSFYTILLLLSRVHPTKTFPNLIPSVVNCLSSRNSKVRLMASLALPCICTDSSINLVFNGLLNKLSSESLTNNQRHGILMSLTSFLKTSQSLNPSSVVPSILEIFKTHDLSTMEALCDLLSTVITSCPILIQPTISWIEKMSKSDDGIGGSRGSLAAGGLLVLICSHTKTVETLKSLTNNFDLHVGVIKSLKKTLRHTRFNVDGVGELLEIYVGRCVEENDFCCYKHEPSLRRLTNMMCYINHHVKDGRVLRKLLKGDEMSRYNSIEILSHTSDVRTEIIGLENEENFRKVTRLLRAVKNGNLIEKYEVFKGVAERVNDDDEEVRYLARECLEGSFRDALEIRRGVAGRMLRDYGVEACREIIEGEKGEGDEERIFERLEPSTYYEKLIVVHECAMAGDFSGIDFENFMKLVENIKGIEYEDKYFGQYHTILVLGCVMKKENLGTLNIDLGEIKGSAEISKAIKAFENMGQNGDGDLKDICFLYY